MDGVPVPSANELISLWGAWAVVVIILIGAVIWLIKQNEKKDAAKDAAIVERNTFWSGEVAKRDATIALKEQRNAELADRLVTVSVNANSNSSQQSQLASQMNVTANQQQTLLTSQQQLVDRLIAAVASIVGSK